jgi:hypothetical protein
MKLGALMLGAYRLIIFISFWCISPFISMEYPSLSHLINVSLKSTLSEISIATLTCFGGLLHGKSSSSLSPKASVCFCQCGGPPVNKRWSDLPFSSSLPNSVFWWESWVHWHSVLLSDSLSFLLLCFDTPCPLMVLFAFIFCVCTVLMHRSFYMLSWNCYRFATPQDFHWGKI